MVSYRMAATSGGTWRQSNHATRPFSDLSADSPPTFAGHAKNSDLDDALQAGVRLKAAS